MGDQHILNALRLLRARALVSSRGKGAAEYHVPGSDNFEGVSDLNLDLDDPNFMEKVRAFAALAEEEEAAGKAEKIDLSRLTPAYHALMLEAARRNILDRAEWIRADPAARRRRWYDADLGRGTEASCNGCAVEMAQVRIRARGSVPALLRGPGALGGTDLYALRPGEEIGTLHPNERKARLSAWLGKLAEKCEC